MDAGVHTQFTLKDACVQTQFTFQDADGNSVKLRLHESGDNALTITHSAEVQKHRFKNSGLRNACAASCGKDVQAVVSSSSD
eukprot:7788496-Pyramimonas_sp.AAC.1